MKDIFKNWILPLLFIIFCICALFLGSPASDSDIYESEETDLMIGF